VIYFTVCKAPICDIDLEIPMKRKPSHRCFALTAAPLLLILGNAFAAEDYCPAYGGLIDNARLLDTSAAIDTNGNLWLWGYFGITNWLSTGNGGPGGGVNGAPSSPVYLADRAIYNPPTKFKALDKLVSVAASAYTVAVIDSDNNLWAWGDSNPSGYCNVFGYDIAGKVAPEKVPDGARQHDLANSTWQPIAQNVVSVAAAEYAYAWVTSDGKVWTSGHNIFAQRGMGTFTQKECLTKSSRLVRQTQIPDDYWPVLPESSGGTGQTPVIAEVYNGYEGFMAQDNRGNIYAWGRSFESGMGTSGYFLNGCKQDPFSNRENNHTRNIDGFPYDPATCPASGVVHTPAGYNNNLSGKLANDWYISKPVFVPEVTALGKAHRGIRKIILGYQHGVALAGDGSVILWGSDELNRNGLNRTELNGQVGIEGIRPYVLCLDENGRQPLTDGKKTDYRRPVNAGCTPVKAVSIASNQFAASLVTADGKVIAWGAHLIGGAFGVKAQLRGPAKNGYEGVYERDGIVNDRDMMHVVWEPALDAPRYRKAVAVTANKDASTLVLEDGEKRVWGENGGGAACGGYGYRSCMPSAWGQGTYGTTLPTPVYHANGAGGSGYYVHNTASDLYIWPPLPVGNLNLKSGEGAFDYQSRCLAPTTN
jgi:alpha-tubulin suppressor-like RCC1 family protein